MTATLTEVRGATGYQLVATDEAEMRAAHADMVQWAVDRRLACEGERADEQEHKQTADVNGWNAKPFVKRIGVLNRRILFYEKIEAALRAGYVIVPNFQMNIFAIRTDDASPRGSERRTGQWGGDAFQQEAKPLPLGTGEYKNPFPAIEERHSQTDDGKGGKTLVRERWAEEFRALNFPLALARPMLMQRTAEAMTVKVFDEIGVAEDTQWRGAGRRGDPIILGRIRNPRKNHPDISFFIGWFFDPSNL